MVYVDLDETNLETILKELRFDDEEISKIKRDSGYYDRYILVQEGPNIGFLTVLRQPFGDPYLKLTLDECDLLNYRGKMPIEPFLDVMDNIFEIPQVARCFESNKEDFKRRGFKEMEEKAPKHTNASKLIHIRFEIENKPTIIISPYVRPMNDNDIPQITNLFSKEYPARSRAVKRMYEADPTACFVHEEGGIIKGTIFGERITDSGTIYVHQLLVKKLEWGRHADRALLNCMVCYARANDLSTITATIRGNLLLYYLRLGAVIDTTVENEQYLVRSQVQR